MIGWGTLFCGYNFSPIQNKRLPGGLSGRSTPRSLTQVGKEPERRSVGSGTGTGTPRGAALGPDGTGSHHPAGECPQKQRAGTVFPPGACLSCSPRLGQLFHNQPARLGRKCPCFGVCKVVMSIKMDVGLTADIRAFALEK